MISLSVYRDLRTDKKQTNSHKYKKGSPNFSYIPHTKLQYQARHRINKYYTRY